MHTEVELSPLNPELRDPIVEILTERAAELIEERRALLAEVTSLKLQLGAAKSEARQLQKQVDDLILREAVYQRARSS